MAIPTIKNDKYTGSCECPVCGKYIRHCNDAKIFNCEKCGTEIDHTSGIDLPGFEDYED